MKLKKQNAEKPQGGKETKVVNLQIGAEAYKRVMESHERVQGTLAAIDGGNFEFNAWAARKNLNNAKNQSQRDGTKVVITDQKITVTIGVKLPAVDVEDKIEEKANVALELMRDMKVPEPNTK